MQTSGAAGLRLTAGRAGDYETFSRVEPTRPHPAPPRRGAAWHRELSVVVASYNGRELLRQTLETFYAIAPDAEVIVSDGSSTDGSAQMVRERFPQAKVVDHPNHGFAHANNVGIAETTRRLILLLNSDLFVTEAALEAMGRRLLEDPRVGAVAPNLANVDGSRQSVFGGLYWPLWLPVAGRRQVKLLSAACVMTRRDVLQATGGLDENLFLYTRSTTGAAPCSTGLHPRAAGPRRSSTSAAASTSAQPPSRSRSDAGSCTSRRKHRWRSARLLKALMGLQSFVLRLVDPRPDWRRTWARQCGMIRTATCSPRPSHSPAAGRTSCPRGPPQPALPPDASRR
jgi:hypothetical protein